MQYRAELDGLRAIAVISVIIFHLGYLPNGYLGVDVFFVISGFLITSIIYKEILNGNFSVLSFYKRRIRRIIPLLLFISFIALILGGIFMLPDDLIGLSKSIIASNLFSNNLLLYLTSSDYWEVSMEFKPLMHTWSLGVEEQFYLVYPLIFIFVSSKRIIVTIITLITIISLFLFLFYGNINAKFYLLPYRFFELSLGGIFALFYFNKKEVNSKLKFIYYTSFILLLFLIFIPYQKNDISLFLCIVTTAFTIALSNYFSKSLISEKILSNRILVYIGKISFSLYMWHQIIFSFARYVLLFEITWIWSIFLSMIILLISVISYNFIEVPFRNSSYSFRKVVYFISILFFINIIASIYLLSVEGIFKNFEVFGQYKNDYKPNIEKLYNKKLLTGSMQNYNENINHYNQPFIHSNRVKILLIGDSFARDIANVLLESTIASQISISYINTRTLSKDNDYLERSKKADLVFLSFSNYFSKKDLNDFLTTYHCSIETDKMYYFGTKNFGYSMGLPYNEVRFRNSVDYRNYYIKIREGYAEQEKIAKEEWGNRYISLLSPIISKDRRYVRCFDDKGRLISHDSAHLSKFGAQFYSKIYGTLFEKLVKENKNEITLYH